MLRREHRHRLVPLPPVPERAALAPFSLADSALKLNNGMPFNPVAQLKCAYSSSISLSPRWQATNTQLEISSCSLLHSSRGTRGPSQGYTNENDPRCAKRGECFACWPHWSQNPAKHKDASAPHAPLALPITSLQRVVCLPATPDIPLGFTVQEVVSISTRLALPCPVFCMRVIQLEGYSW